MSASSAVPRSPGPAPGGKVALAYIGDEQPSWGRTAFHRPRHYFVMPAILYLQAVLRSASRREVEAVYLNRSAEEPGEMLTHLAAVGAEVVGFSCYSWNVDATLELARELKTAAPKTKVLLGGPEVAFADSAGAEEFLAANPDIDGLCFGEGEGVIVALVDQLTDAAPVAPVDGALVRRHGELVMGAPVAPPIDLTELPEIDPTAAEVLLGAGAGLAAVYQTYRGCPYSCAYCSFHGGTAGIRRFPLARVERELGALLAAGIACIHFADSVFDLSNRRAKQILGFCRDHNRVTSLFCYAAFQGLDDELAALLEQTRTQVGVGLQSFDEEVLARVGRRFSVPRFRDSLALMAEREINWYVDVMFGLPGDDMAGFQRTIDEVTALAPPFLMPFPLTVIPRTELAGDLEGYEVVRHDDARIREAVRPTSGIVYADIGLARSFDLADLDRFDDFATAVFVVLQRYPQSMRVLFEYAAATAQRGHGLTPFVLLERVGHALGERLDGVAVDIFDPPPVDGVSREAAGTLLAEMGAEPVEVEALAALMHLEGGLDLMLRRPGRERLHAGLLEREPRRIPVPAEASWLPTDETIAFTGAQRLVRLAFDYADLLRLAELGSAIAPRETHVAALAPYEHFAVRVLTLDDLERAICEMVPASREVALASIVKRIERRADGGRWREALRRLTEVGLLGAYG